jgi:excisionase family DNA binding protein
MRITIEIDDEEVRRVLAPLVPHLPPALAPAPTKLLTVQEVADHLAVSRSKAYELLYKGEIQSLTIGRTRRVSAAALTEFIARPKENPFDYHPAPRQLSTRQVSPPKAPAPSQPSTRKRPSKPTPTIDLSPRPVAASSGTALSDTEFEEVLSSMLAHGWPTDVIDDIRTDHKQGIDRVYVLAINDAARYLGLSRYATDKLIQAGKLRLFTIAPAYRDQKPSQRIPAKDVAALR